MSLRLRLIVAFFLLSVVPLGALTYYSYQSNVKALREAAQHEAELLASDLSQRMQIVTTQLSERVERLMDAAATQTASAEPAPAAVPNPAPAASEPATTVEAATVGDRYAVALGEVAMLLNNVELRGYERGRGGGRGGPGGPGGGRGGFPGRDPGPPGTAPSGGASTVPPNPAAPAVVPATPGSTATVSGLPGSTMPSAGTAARTPPGDRSQGGRRDRGGFGPTRGGAPGNTGAGAASGATAGAGGAATSGATTSSGATPQAGAGAGAGRTPAAPGTSPAPGFPPPPAGVRPPPGPGGPGGPPSPDDPNRIRIDLRPIREEMLKQLVPEGQWEKLTPEERRKVFDEINQRVQGFVQGIRVGAAELQKKAEEVQRLADEAKTTADAARESENATNAARGSQSTAADAVRGSKTPESPATPKPGAVPATPRVAPAPPAAPTPPVAQAPRPPGATPVPAPPTARPAPAASATGASGSRRTAITGSRMDVTVERNGRVEQVNAELNLDNLLGTVFSNTRRDRGEVPFAVSKDGHLYTPTAGDRQTIEALGAPVTFDAPTGLTMLPRWVLVTTMDPTGTGLKFGIARPVGDSMATLRLSTARNAAFGLGFIGLALIGIVPLSGRLTRNLSTLNEGVRRIAHGDYGARVTVKSKDEIGELATAFNQMAEDVEKHQRAAVEQERIKRELELGRQIQHEMLPHTPLMFGLTEIQGVSVPAREVGGDFFNYFALPSGQIALLVGDVSGKGVGAALLMANIQASLRTRLSMGQDLVALAREVDLDIESNTPGTVYATLFVGMLDPASRVLRYVNAGHNPQYVLRRTGELERMHSSGLPVGLLAGHGYKEPQVQLFEGDVLFFYTDGCVEAESETGEMFGPERLEAVLTSGAVLSAADILARIELAVSTFRGSREPFDDATMMAVKVG